MAVVTQASQAMYIIGRHHDRGNVELLLLLSCLPIGHTLIRCNLPRWNPRTCCNCCREESRVDWQIGCSLLLLTGATKMESNMVSAGCFGIHRC